MSGKDTNGKIKTEPELDLFEDSGFENDMPQSHDATEVREDELALFMDEEPAEPMLAELPLSELTEPDSNGTQNDKLNASDGVSDTASIQQPALLVAESSTLDQAAEKSGENQTGSESDTAFIAHLSNDEATAAAKQSNRTESTPTPVYAPPYDQQKSSSSWMAIAAALVITVTGGMFLFNNNTDDSSTAIIEHENSEATDLASSAVNTGNQKAANTKAKEVLNDLKEKAEKELPIATASTPDNSARLTMAATPPVINQVIETAELAKGEATPATKDQNPEATIHTRDSAVVELANTLEPSIEHNLAAEGSSTIAVIEPDTPVQLDNAPQTTHAVKPSPVINQQPDSAATASVQWYIHLVNVTSDKSARQHIARMRAMGVESEAVRISNNGRIWHNIRIVGFNSKADASKHLPKITKTLGISKARVESL